MKRITILLFLLGAAPAFAQQAAPSIDPKLAVCRQIESERTGQVIELAAEVQSLGKQLKAVQDELAKLKAVPEKKP